MKDLRIVIVSWNVEKLLERCLKSLPMACEGLDWECVVVDNASSDGSKGLVSRLALDIPQLGLIANETNDGFAKACNRGAEGSDAKYVLFLNPDTECPAGSITKLVRLADERPKAGIFGPKLLNADGTMQPSVRRFPTVWDQLGILLKLHHLFRRWSVFRRYFADDVDADKEQTVDQVMGACFLVRKELLDAKLGFDERYFIWMEEVDFCLTAKQKGWDVVYLPQVSVIHHGGQSFAQVFTAKKQKYFTASLKKYFDKWHPGIQAWSIRVASVIGMALAYIASFVQSSYGKWTGLVLLIEIVSAATIFHNTANTIACILAGLVMLVVSYKKPALGLAVLALELVIGSQGHLLQFGWPSAISLREVLTAAFLLAWAANAINAKRIGWTIDRGLRHTPYVVLAVLICWAILRGYLAHAPGMFADANAWFELVLLLPVLDIADREGVELRKAVVPALIVGTTWLGVETLLIELAFSHQAPHIMGLYLWIRRTGLGEVTKLAGVVYRVFIQSQIYLVAGYMLVLAWYAKHARPSRLADWTMALTTAGLSLSMSRSFAVGMLIGTLALACFVWRRPTIWKAVWRSFLWSFIGSVLALLVIFFPLPGLGTFSASDLVNARLNDAAAQSRWELLPAMWQKIEQAPILGSGFGATVTYHTYDPRQVEQGDASAYSTDAFEWGWLDHWIKFGIFGIPVIAWILISLGSRIWKTNEEDWLRIGAVVCLITLAAVHLTTPYLNHPLGFLFLLLGEGMISSSIRKTV